MRGKPLSGGAVAKGLLNGCPEVLEIRKTGGANTPARDRRTFFFGNSSNAAIDSYDSMESAITQAAHAQIIRSKVGRAKVGRADGHLIQMGKKWPLRATGQSTWELFPSSAVVL
jgi:hypothetical protein